MKNLKNVLIAMCGVIAMLTFVREAFADCTKDIQDGSTCGTSSPATYPECIAVVCPTSRSCTSGNEDQSCTEQDYDAHCQEIQYWSGGNTCYGNGSTPVDQPTTHPCKKVAANSSGC
jgi:hypothetical protein